MFIKKYALCFLLLTLVSFSINAQDCKSLEARLDLEERAAIEGETMGQKLESLLFWSQEEKERRFPMMQNIFPSIQVPAGSRVYPLEERENITPQWENKTTLSSYMKENHIGGVIVVQNDKIKLEKYADGVDKETLWTSFSMAKSVSSMLLGIALKEGAIESLDDTLEKYIEEFKGYD